MARYLFATVSVLALASAAHADDAASWTGPYLGLNGGISWHSSDSSYMYVNPPPVTLNFSTTGVTLGGQAGYNWQYQNVVFGLEADAAWLSNNGTKFDPIEGITFTSRLDWLATIRARMGVTFSPTMFYVTAGPAFGGVANDTDIIFNSSYSNRETRVGWTAGAGIEHMFNQRWTAKAEVLYVDLGRTTVLNSMPIIPVAAGYTGTFRNTAVVGRVGINLKW